MLTRSVVVALFSPVACLVLAFPTYAEKRVALVVGNGAYLHATPLPNPPNDAAAIAAALRRLNFEHVTVLKDLGAEALRAALLNFEPKVTGADIAVVYFAGHGIEVDGQNFLIPIDARLARAAATELEAIPLSTVTTVISAAQKLRLVILDACRTNPFRARMSADAGGARKRSIGRGLKPIEPGENELIVFAAAASIRTPSANDMVDEVMKSKGEKLAQEAVDSGKFKSESRAPEVSGARLSRTTPGEGRAHTPPLPFPRSTLESVVSEVHNFSTLCTKRSAGGSQHGSPSYLGGTGTVDGEG
jgi:hypothetical protein